jgi:hypothetical protein
MPMTQEFRIDERALSKGELTNASLVANRAFFNDPFFRFLSPSDHLRSRGLTIFFRANLAHLGEGGRIVTVREPNGTIKGMAPWLPTERYPQSRRTQLAHIPGTFRVRPITGPGQSLRWSLRDPSVTPRPNTGRSGLTTDDPDLLAHRRSSLTSRHVPVHP